MDRGQETTELKDTNSSRLTTSSLTPLPPSQQASIDNRLSLARERNDRNRDHLSTAFRVYKQLYGEEAAKEAFIEIASNIAKDDDLEFSQNGLGNKDIDNQEKATDGTGPKYLAYRQSLSTQKDPSFINSSTHSSPSQGQMQNDMKANPTITVAPVTAVDDAINYSNNSKPAISYPQTISRAMEDETSLAIISTAVSSEAISGSVVESLPDFTTPNPPKYIKYRTALSKSATSSIQGDSVNTSYIGTAEVSEDDNNSTSPTEALLGQPVQSTKVDSESSRTKEYDGKMPRYVKYRTSLSKSATGSTASSSVVIVQPIMSSMSEDEPANNFARNEEQEIITAAQSLLAGMRQSEDMQHDRDSNSPQPQHEAISSHRYMAYRSSLKEKPWTSPPIDPFLLSSSPSGGLAVYESFDSTTDSAVAQSQSSGVDSTEGASRRQRSNLIPPASPGRLDTDTSFDVSEGATAESILSDLHSVERDNRTLISESTAASSNMIPSVAEQLLISSSASDDGMGVSLADQSTANSFADHSAATPIISNSTHKKDRKSRVQTGASFLSFDSNSSFDSDSPQDEPLAYMASVPASPNLVGGKEDSKNMKAISPTSDRSPKVENPDESSPIQQRISASPEPVMNVVESFESDDSADVFNSALNLTSVLTSGPSPKSPLARESESSDSDSSSSVSSSSSSGSDSSCSNGQKSELGPIDSKIDKSVEDGNDLSNLDAPEPVETLKIEDDKTEETLEPELIVTGGSTSVSDSTDTRRKSQTAQSTKESEDDIEAGNVSCLAKPKIQEPKKSREQKQLERRKRFLYATVLFFALLLILGLGLGIGLSKRRDNNKPLGPQIPSSVPPRPSPGGVPTRAPTPSSPNTIAPSVTGGALRALLSSLSSDGGAALNTAGTPQNIAYEWLLDDPNLFTYDDARRVQRYSLATFYYSTNGDNWTENSGWATYTNECDWFSRSSRILSCDDIGQYRNLDLGFNEVSGTIPAEIGMLTRLSRVIISGGIRKTMTGSLPTELGLLQRMQTFLIQGNSVFGTVPNTLLQWIDLETIDLSLNNLSGWIPSEIGSWKSIRFLDFSGNRFDGSVPSTIEELTNLERMSIGDNQLTGVLPTNIDRLTSLKVVNLEKNKITGIPTQVGNMRNLETLTAYENSISGRLITEIGGLISLRRLSLSKNSFTGPIPAEIGSMASLRYLDLSINQFSGPIPTQIGQLSDILSLQLDSNRLNGTIPIEFGALSGASLIRIDGNDITGEVPRDVCDTFTVDFPTFYVDCAGEPPQVDCPDRCCTFCCTDSGSCECAFLGSPYEFLCR